MPQIPLLHYFKCKNIYSANIEGLFYRLTPGKRKVTGPDGAEQEESILTLDYWPGPWTLERTDPALRRRGYATAMLNLALEECRRLGLSQVMLTCEKTNVASARTMLHCGAVLQDELLMGSMTIQRYWIEL